MEKGLVFGIQHFSIHDGPGIRSNVFLKGCPLRCLWCHNPEGLSCGIGLQYYERNCTHCGRCGHIYRDIKSTEKLSDDQKRDLARHCPYRALRLVGELMTAEEVVAEVVKDARYFKSSGGGMTISGGEPMLQAKFAIELAKLAKEQGIMTALETSGFSALENYIQIMPYIDTFLWDYKATSEETHKKLVGVSNELILANLHCLYERGAKIVLRCPLIPGVNDSEEHLRGIANMCKRYPNLAAIEVMPYHKMGVSKAKRIGYEQEEYYVPEKELKNYWKSKIEEYGGKLTRMN
ncbi:glycyl-radical enzyme activating protein [Propionispora vibrioides]|uniref:Pyruvate formate lyase activating enzyme n=1 Tax=Propionispora vibrioides TaxID=112903 RepID=A0A1H8T642_9FIRM|nr:glycyl-radical enzyme activating protein [Propionispora vibrioides]SEO86295.1 pyruvate formate lyase activating enzyme [Propionispora vibrioides]